MLNDLFFVRGAYHERLSKIALQSGKTDKEALQEALDLYFTVMDLMKRGSKLVVENYDGSIEVEFSGSKSPDLRVLKPLEASSE